MRIEDYFLEGQKIVKEFELQNSQLPDLQEIVNNNINKQLFISTNIIKDFPRNKIIFANNRVSKLQKSKRNKHVDLSLKGGSPLCEVLNPNKVSNLSEWICINLKIFEKPTICLLPFAQDSFISSKIASDGLWEDHTVRVLIKILSENENIGLYDIGAHIGEFSLVAAAKGHKVVAVEPNIISANCLAKSILINHYEDLITIVRNAISDERGSFELNIPSDNIGGTALSSQDADPFCDDPSCPPHANTILLTDLLEVTNVELAVIKIDVEGHEHKVFKNVDRFFHFVNVVYIIMEWKILRSYFGTEMDDNKDKELVYEMIDILTEYGFKPFGLSDFSHLHREFWYGWNEDIIWIKEGFSIPKY